MEGPYRENIRRHAPYLQDNLRVTPRFLDYLYGNSAITPELQDKLLQIATRSEQITLLCSNIVRCGPRAYDVFLGALIFSGQRFIAEKLQSGFDVGLNYYIPSGHRLIPNLDYESNSHLYQQLRQTGIDLDSRDLRENGLTTLQEAVSLGCYDLVCFLLQIGCNKAVLDEANRTLLHLAVRGGHLDIVKVLLTVGCSVNERDNAGRTVLHEAFLSCRNNIALFLINSNICDLDARDNQDRRPLYLAAQSADFDSFRVLYCRGNSKSAPYLIHAACSGGSREIVLMLLKEDRTLVHESLLMTGETPLYVACSCGHPEIVDILLHHGANCNAESSFGNNVTPLHIASDVGNIDTVNMLIKSGADINARDSFRDTPLHSAAVKSHKGVVVQLLDSEANADTPGDSGRTALHITCIKGDVELAQLLLARGANVHARSGDLLSYTPLHLVCSYETRFTPKGISDNKFILAKCLLGHDRSTALDESLDHSTPVHIACNNGHHELVQLTLEYAPECVNKPDGNGLTPLHCACMNTDSEEYILCARRLLEKQAEVNAKNGSGDSPLHSACAWGNVKLTRLLLENGADPEAENNDGITPREKATLKTIHKLLDDLSPKGPSERHANECNPSVIYCESPQYHYDTS